MALFLTLLSGICWTIVYIELVRQGFKYKTYGMPLYALGLNFMWEWVYGILGPIYKIQGGIGAQSIVNIIWALLDTAILATYFKYGKKYFPEKAKKLFIPWGIFSLIACAIMQAAFIIEFGLSKAQAYSAFAQNAAMSVMFVVMLFTRGDYKGQSFFIAIAKWLGTLAPTILIGYMHQNRFCLVLGMLCSAFDIAYIWFLRPSSPLLNDK